MPVQHSADFWVGSLAMTVAIASTDPEPHRILKSALREFLASRTEGNELAAMLRATLKEGKPHERS